jgi:enoyl-CoA hydratase/carnithine racemase
MAAEILRRLEGGVLFVSINRAERRNALNAAVIDELRNAFDDGARDARVRAIVLTGEGDRAFCAGADLDPKAASFGAAAHVRSPFADLLRAMMECEKPIIARINGACVAGGMGLLGAADIAIACDDAQFGLPEVKVGVFPMMVAALLQERLLIAPRRLAHWAFTGAPFNAAEALEAGLINRAVPRASLDTAIGEAIEAINKASPAALRFGKRALGKMRGMGVDAALAYAEGQIQLLGAGADAREGLAAFMEKRAPVWSEEKS